MPKPVLSDSLFNADDVATAILDSAELSVTNQDFAVTDRTSLFQKHSTNISSWNNCKAYSFNGFMFLQGVLVMTNGVPSAKIDLISITDSVFFPDYKAVFTAASKEGDGSYNGIITTTGKIQVEEPVSSGDIHWRGIINCWYRF